MELKVATFIFGSILFSIGMFGGGFQIKELSVPKVGRISRFIATLLGLFFILMGFGLEGAEAPSSPTPLPLVSPQSPDSSSQSEANRQEEAAKEQNRQEAAAREATRRRAESTHVYWMTWKNIGDQVNKYFQKYDKTTYSVEKSQELSDLYVSITDALTDLSVNEVDPELVGLAADATVFYQRRVTLYSQQANILYRYQQFAKENNSSDKVAEAIIRGIFSEDALVVPKEMMQEQKEFEREWEENLHSFNQVDNGMSELAARRDALRLKLASEYQLDFVKWE
jgi:uncharacterized FlaG/YvyC family protein